MEVRIIDRDNQDDFDKAFNEAYTIRTKEDVKRMFSEQYVPDIPGFQARRNKIFKWTMKNIEPDKPGQGNSPLRKYYTQLTGQIAEFEARLREPDKMDMESIQSYKKAYRKVITGIYSYWERLSEFGYNFETLIRLFEEGCNNFIEIHNRDKEEQNKITKEFAIVRAVKYFKKVLEREENKEFHTQNQGKISELEKFVRELEKRLAKEIYEANKRKLLMAEADCQLIKLDYQKLINHLIIERKYFEESDRERLIYLFTGKKIAGTINFKNQANVWTTLFYDLIEAGRIKKIPKRNNLLYAWICRYFTWEDNEFKFSYVKKNISQSNFLISGRISPNEPAWINTKPFLL